MTTASSSADDCAATYKTKEFYQAFMNELERILLKHTKSDGSVLSISDDKDVYLGMTVDAFLMAPSSSTRRGTAPARRNGK